MNKIVENRLNISPDYQLKAYNSQNFLQSNWHQNKFYVVNKILNLNRSSRVLDLGTGSGVFEINFANKVKEVVGVDYNVEVINFLSNLLKVKKIKNVRLIRKDVRDIAKTKEIGKFDFILIVDMLEHIRVKDAEKLVGSLKSMLNPNGHICVVTPNYKSPWYFMELMLDCFTFVPKLSGEQHLAKFYKANLNKIFAENGFACQKFVSFNLISYLFPLRKISKMICETEISLPFSFGNLIFGDYALRKYGQK